MAGSSRGNRAGLCLWREIDGNDASLLGRPKHEKQANLGPSPSSTCFIRRHLSLGRVCPTSNHHTYEFYGPCFIPCEEWPNDFLLIKKYPFVFFHFIDLILTILPFLSFFTI